MAIHLDLLPTTAKEKQLTLFDCSLSILLNIGCRGSFAVLVYVDWFDIGSTWHTRQAPRLVASHIHQRWARMAGAAPSAMVAEPRLRYTASIQTSAAGWVCLIQPDADAAETDLDSQQTLGLSHSGLLEDWEAKNGANNWKLSENRLVRRQQW